MTQTYWVLRDHIAPGSDIQDVAVPSADFSNITRIVTFKKVGGSPVKVVVRRYGADKSDPAAYARREFAALELLAGSEVRAAEPVLLDEDGSVLGTPGIVTSVLEGEPTVKYGSDSARVREIARVLASIHRIKVSEESAERLMDAAFEAAYFLRGEKRASMLESSSGAEIVRVCEELWSEMSVLMSRLVHLDFWSGNLLWDGTQLSGVVDWEEASVGDPLIDLSYFRIDLRNISGQRLVDEFTDAYVVESEVEIDPRKLAYWELAAAARSMPDPGRGLSEAVALGDTWSSAESLRESVRTVVANAMAVLRSG